MEDFHFDIFLDTNFLTDPKVADFANEQWSWRKCTMQYHEIYKNLTSH